MKEICTNCEHKNNWIGCFECDGEFYNPKMKEIKKKISPKYFEEVAEGKKDFEIRKDDSDYGVGDILVLQECYQEAIPFSHNSKGEPIVQTVYTGNEITKRIKYKITHEEFPQGIQEGYCILGLDDISGQQFKLGDIAYFMDEDYRFFEGMVYRIELEEEGYSYAAYGCDFESKDIGDWVFTSEIYREIHVQNLFEGEVE
jgi:hypothetical protein